MLVAGGLSAEDTPVPIPNTVVKLCRADGTAGVTWWESTSLPAHLWAHPSGWALLLVLKSGCGDVLSHCVSRRPGVTRGSVGHLRWSQPPLGASARCQHIFGPILRGGPFFLYSDQGVATYSPTASHAVPAQPTLTRCSPNPKQGSHRRRQTGPVGHSRSPLRCHPGSGCAVQLLGSWLQAGLRSDLVEGKGVNAG